MGSFVLDLVTLVLDWLFFFLLNICFYFENASPNREQLLFLALKGLNLQLPLMTIESLTNREQVTLRFFQIDRALEPKGHRRRVSLVSFLLQNCCGKLSRTQNYKLGPILSVNYNVVRQRHTIEGVLDCGLRHRTLILNDPA